VLDRDREPLPVAALTRETGLGVLHHQLDLSADEPERVVGQERPRQQARFAENLKAVADPEHRLASCRMLGHRLHRRREARERPRPQVVAVREASRHDHHVDALQVGLLVPDEARIAHSAAGKHRVPLVAGARELEDAKRGQESSSIS
jgi:hypothetical protein